MVFLFSLRYGNLSAPCRQHGSCNVYQGQRITAHSIGVAATPAVALSDINAPDAHEWGVRVMRILQLVSVMLFALVTGVFWGTWFSLGRSMDGITAATFLEVGKVMISNLGRPMSLLLPTAILSAVPIMYLLYRRHSASAFVLASLAVSLMLAAMTVTLLVNVPLDYLFVDWTLATLPPDWRDLRNRWEFYHGVRTMLSVAALCSLVGSVLLSRNRSGAANLVRRAA
jgi:uncharacterized membrane protein